MSTVSKPWFEHPPSNGSTLPSQLRGARQKRRFTICCKAGGEGGGWEGGYGGCCVNEQTDDGIVQENLFRLYSIYNANGRDKHEGESEGEERRTRVWSLGDLAPVSRDLGLVHKD